MGVHHGVTTVELDVSFDRWRLDQLRLLTERPPSPFTLFPSTRRLSCPASRSLPFARLRLLLDRIFALITEPRGRDCRVSYYQAPGLRHPRRPHR